MLPGKQRDNNFGWFELRRILIEQRPLFKNVEKLHDARISRTFVHVCNQKQLQRRDSKKNIRRNAKKQKYTILGSRGIQKTLNIRIQYPPFGLQIHRFNESKLACDNSDHGQPDLKPRKREQITHVLQPFQKCRK